MHSFPATAAGRFGLKSFKGNQVSDHPDTPEWIQQAMEVRVERNNLFHAHS